MKTTRAIFPTPSSPFTTPRLLIRPPQESDFADLRILTGQLEVMQWTSHVKPDVDGSFTRKWLEKSMPPNDDKTFNFVIEELSNPGQVIGCIGAHKAEPPECGYMLRSEFWAKGYATEAQRAWLQKYWELPRKEVDVDDELGDFERHVDDGVLREVLRATTVDFNTASRRVLEKCGFVRGGSEDLEEHGRIVKLAHFYLEMPNP